MEINQIDFMNQALKLKSKNCLRINDFLNIDFANKIKICLTTEVVWDLACRINNESIKITNCSDVKELKEDQRHQLKENNSNFDFIYNSYMLVTAYIENKNPEHFLNRVLEFLNSIEVVDFFKKLTNNQNITKLNAQATRYKPGHYLTQHNDRDEVENREYAYVIGLTKDWKPEWGGLLHILNKKGDIVKTFIPEFNTLTIFKVPQNHYVSYVTPFAKKDRLSITGWLLSN